MTGRVVEALGEAFMGISDRVAELTAKLATQRGAIETEEATRNAFVMPFM
jgi:predicted type IV restriction endonuclease